MDNPTGITDALTPAIEHGRMTRAEAIRHILDLGYEVAVSDNPHMENRAAEALLRLGVTEGAIAKAANLP